MRGKLQKARLHMNVNYVIKLWEVRVDNVNKTVYKQSYPDEQPAQMRWALRCNGSQQTALP